MVAFSFFGVIVLAILVYPFFHKKEDDYDSQD